MSNALGYLRGELNQAGGGTKQVSVGKRILEVGFVKKRFYWQCITKSSVGIIRNDSQ
jgi:hypothetical protein